ncbi:glycosyltransferase family 4 protein [Pseudomonas marginalis]|uniref:Glycosyltransferase family 4 protein n=1 Tax=Pseudomonas marginalis TaxID=298 RepID=A0A9X9BKK4_PSEMA|nr:glycosyltransferase family 4 protein [Pseudomonas marginalis]TWR49443.1 glycosyltransferase family 4 protein [Pseudomonas marginalis]SEB42284.1 Glycosyltransferase involved in cell wall bisynthesis [Pseudomonas marginalis]
MSILVIASYPDSLVNFRGPLLDALLSKGLAVHVAAPDLTSSHPVRSLLERKGITVHSISLNRTGMNPVSDFFTLIQLWKLLRVLRPDYVLAYTVKPVVYGLIAARFASKKIIRIALITGLGYAFQKQHTGGCLSLIVKTLVQRLYRYSLSGAQAVFFQNPDDRALFQSMGILSAESRSTVVNGSGVCLDDFTVAPFPEQTRFLLIARLLGDKGVREYAMAARKIRMLHPDVAFDLVGWIDDNPDAISEQELQGWIAEGTLEYHGKLSDVRPVIAASSVYVLPSYREGTPRTVLEAMSMGRAIITTDAPGCRETVIEGLNGFMVTVQSVDELVNAMSKFVQCPQRIVSMGAASRKLAEDKYDVNKVNNVMLAVIGL